MSDLGTKGWEIIKEQEGTIFKLKCELDKATERVNQLILLNTVYVTALKAIKDAVSDGDETSTECHMAYLADDALNEGAETTQGVQDDEDRCGCYDGDGLYLRVSECRTHRKVSSNASDSPH
jgi:hypothetical protein